MKDIKLVIAPTALASATDIARISKNVSYYTNANVFVVVFAKGSCAFPPPGTKAIDGAVHELKNLPANIGFEVREMDDSNFVVKFTEHVFGVVFRDEFERIRDQVAAEIGQSAASETIIGKPGTPADHFLIGVIARTRLMHDIEEPVAAASLEPVRD